MLKSGLIVFSLFFTIAAKADIKVHNLTSLIFSGRNPYASCAFRLGDASVTFLNTNKAGSKMQLNYSCSENGAAKITLTTSLGPGTYRLNEKSTPVCMTTRGYYVSYNLLDLMSSDEVMLYLQKSDADVCAGSEFSAFDTFVRIKN